MAKKLGERLIESGLLTAEGLERALRHQASTGHRLGECLVELKLVPEASLLRLLAAEQQTKYVTAEKLAQVQIASEVLDRVPVSLAEAHHFLPLAIDAERKILSGVMSEPQNRRALEEIARVTRFEEVFVYVGLRSTIEAAIQRHYYGDEAAFTSREQREAAGRAEEAEASAERDATDEPRSTRGGQAGTRAVERDRGWVASNATPTFSDADYLHTLDTLFGVLDATRGHAGRAAQLARQATTVGRRVGLNPLELSHLAMAAYLHDLSRPMTARVFTLSNNAANPEWKAEARRAALAPLRLFESVNLPATVTTLLHQRYEAFDGSGVPHGLKGEDLHLGARVLAAVRSYMDLTLNSANAYRRVFSKEEALAHLNSEAGGLYDPTVIDALKLLHSGALLKRRLLTEGRTVLVVEPDGAARKALVEALEAKGLNVHTAPQLEGTLETVKGGGADLVAVGLRQGAKEISSFLQASRLLPHCAAIPLAVLGSPEDKQGRDRLLNAGASLVLDFPGVAEETAAALAQLHEQTLAFGIPGHVVRGSFDELPPKEFLRFLGANKKWGRVAVSTRGGEALAYLESGKLVYATYQRKHGAEALEAMLAISHAEFRYEPETLLLEPPELDVDLAQLT